jgi:hypothetical protein
MEEENPAFIFNVTENIEQDRRMSFKKPARAHGVSQRTINLTLRHELNLTLRHDLNFTKKSARWVLKLLMEHMKKKRVTTR